MAPPEPAAPGPAHTPPPGGPRFPAPEIPRVLPFAVYLLIPALGAGFAPHPDYSLYAVKVLVTAALLFWLRPALPEMRLSASLPAVLVGVAMAIVWELLSRPVPGLGRLVELARHGLTGTALAPEKPPVPWNPLKVFPDAPALAYGLVAIRVLGRSLVVPLVEEVFYRSFVYRYLIQPRFESVPLATRHLGAWLATSALFGVVHPDQWLAGLVCGLSYQWLVLRSGRLGDAILAHGITNGLLSAWVIHRGSWDFS